MKVQPSSISFTVNDGVSGSVHRNEHKGFAAEVEIPVPIPSICAIRHQHRISIRSYIEPVLDSTEGMNTASISLRIVPGNGNIPYWSTIHMKDIHLCVCGGRIITYYYRYFYIPNLMTLRNPRDHSRGIFDCHPGWMHQQAERQVIPHIYVFGIYVVCVGLTLDRCGIWRADDHRSIVRVQDAQGICLSSRQRG